MIDIYDGDTDFVSPDERDHILAEVRQCDPSVEQLIAEGASYAEAAKPRSAQENYLVAVRRNEAMGKSSAKLTAAMAALKMAGLAPADRELLWAFIAIMRDGLNVAPSTDALARLLGTSVASIDNRLSKLVKHGLLMRCRMAFDPEDGGRSVSHYTLGHSLLIDAARDAREAAEFMRKQCDYRSDRHRLIADHIVADLIDVDEVRTTADLTNASRSEIEPSISDLIDVDEVSRPKAILTSPTSVRSEIAPYIRNARARSKASIDGASKSSTEPAAAAASASSKDGSIDEGRPGRSTINQAQNSTEAAEAATKVGIGEGRRAREVALPTFGQLDLIGGDGVGGMTKITVTLSDDREITAMRGEILQAARDVNFPELSAMAEAASLMRGLAERPKAWRPPSMMAYFREKFAEAVGSMHATSVRVEAQIARAKSPGGDQQAIGDGTVGGIPRRYTRNLEQSIQNQAFYPLARGAANAILERADKLRTKGDPIVTTADVEAVLAALKKDDQPSHTELAERVAINAARRVAGFNDGPHWLTDVPGIVKQIAERWPHLPLGVIEQQVAATSVRPRLAGVRAYDWGEGSRDEVVAVLLSRFGDLIRAIQQWEMEPIDGVSQWLEGSYRHAPSWLASAFDFEPDRHERERLEDRARDALAPRLAELRKAWGVSDVVAKFREMFAETIISITGNREYVLPTDVRIEIGCTTLREPFNLTPLPL